MRHSVFFLLLGALALSAQYLHHPTKNVPRKADGSVDMAAPAPRLADGKPDFSGIWINAIPNRPLRPGENDRPGDPAAINAARTMANLGIDLEGGTLPYQDWLKPIVKQRTETMAVDDPHIRCWPDNFIRAYGMPHLLKFVHAPDLLVVLNEMNAGYRQVFTDGRDLPKDPLPSLQGYSSAKWDGDVLVIDTIGVRDDTWIDWNGSVLTEAAKVQERIRRPSYGFLEVEVTVDDPKAYTKPWTVNLKQRVVVDTELVDEICVENEQSLQHMK